MCLFKVDYRKKFYETAGQCVDADDILQNGKKTS